MSNNTCPTNFIPDIPQDKDLFEGKPHQLIADAILEFMNKNKGGITIGLEGGWGSGKSTVINLLINNKQNNKIEIFIFDAWAHSDDPLRRSFLETLLQKLESIGWVNEEKQKEFEDKIKGNTKDSTTTTKPKLGPLGAPIALFALFGPLALIFINLSIRDGLVFPWQPNIGPDYLFFVGLVFYFFPILLFAKIKKQNEISDENVIASFIKEFERETKTITIESPNPTSVEFEYIFLDIINYVLKPEDRKLIIVLDNIDRIESHEALSILSTLQTFFQHCQQKTIKKIECREIFDRLWVIIPYDRSAIEKIWEKNSSDQIESYMLNKRFQLLYKVPPLVMSNWKEYLNSLIRQAFPNHSTPKDLEQIYQIIRLTFQTYSHEKKSTPNKEPSPSPRELITIVNQIGVFHSQWCSNGIPFYHIVFYSAYCNINPNANIPEKLLTNEFPSSEIQYLLGGSPRVSIAGLWFNTDTSIANELLIRNSVVSSLRNGDIETLISIKSNTQNLWATLSNFSFDITLEFLFIEDYVNSVYTLKNSGLLDDNNSKASKELFLSKVNEGMLAATQNSPLTNKFVEKLIIYISYFDREILFNKIVKILNTPFLKEEKPFYNETNIDDWSSAFLSLIPEIFKYIKNKKGIIKIPVNDQSFIKAIENITQNDSNHKYWNLIEIESPKEFFDKIALYISKGSFSSSSLLIIDFIKIKYTGAKFNWNGIIDIIYKRLYEIPPDKYNDTEVGPLFYSSWLIHKLFLDGQNHICGKLQIAVQNGILAHYFFESVNTNNKYYTSWVLFLYLYANPGFPQPQIQFGNSTLGYDYILHDIFENPQKHLDLTNNFLEILIHENELDLLQSVWEKNISSHNWISYCLLLLSTSPENESIDIQFIYSNLEEIKKFLGEDWKNFIKTIIKNSNLIDLITSNKFDIKQIWLYIEIINNATGTKSEEFNKWIKDKALLIKKELWLEHINSKGSLIDLIGVLNDNKITLSEAFSEALCDFASLNVKSNIPIVTSAEDSNLFFSILENDDLRMSTKRNILDLLIVENQSIPEEFFNIFGEQLNDRELLINNSKTVSHLFIPLVKNMNAAGLQWLSTVFTNNPTLLNNYLPKEDVKLFKSEIKESFYLNLSQEAGKSLRLIARKIKIRIPAPLKSSSTS